MDDKPNCDCCGQEMKLAKAGHVNVDRGVCRIRRFYCSLCDIYKTIYANGSYDDDIMPYIAVKDQQKLFRQQQDYEKNFL